MSFMEPRPSARILPAIITTISIAFDGPEKVALKLCVTGDRERPTGVTDS